MAEASPKNPALQPRPSFGIVVPFYNEANYLPRTLESLLQQTRLPDQVVLVDNASRTKALGLRGSGVSKRRCPPRC